MKGCTEEKEPSRRGDSLACWPDALSTQPSLLPSFTSPCLHCFTFSLTNAYSLTYVGWKWLGLALEWTCKINLWFLDCLKRMWSFSWDKHWRAVRKGFSAVCPSLLTLLDGRAASICWIAPHCPQMFVVATVCTQGRRMLWPFDCVAVLLSPSLLHFKSTHFSESKDID